MTRWPTSLDHGVELEQVIAELRQWQEEVTQGKGQFLISLGISEFKCVGLVSRLVMF
jgi:hypothetical protein